MTTPTRRAAARPLNDLLNFGVLADAPDARLLDHYRTGGERGGEAFRILVERHGPMVLSVCRGVVRDPDEADDVFQAVFLVLIRRAGAIRKADSLGPWLHGVALRIARRARRRSWRRPVRIPPGACESLADPVPPVGESDPAARIHAAIDRLPDRYRHPLILCCLEDLSYEQAARALGLTEPALRGRLQRARKRLEARLSAEGVQVPASLAAAGPSRALVDAVLAQAASGSSSTIPVSISSLANGAILAMSYSPLKPVLFSALATLGVAGSVVVARQSPEPATVQEPPATQSEEAKQSAAIKQRIEDLMKTGPTPEQARENEARLRAALAQVLDFEVPKDATLESLLKLIKKKTMREDYAGVPIYVDPLGLHEADVTMATPPQAMFGGLTVGGVLKANLEGLNLSYIVHDGFITISSRSRIMELRQEVLEEKLDALNEKLDRLLPPHAD